LEGGEGGEVSFFLFDFRLLSMCGTCVLIMMVWLQIASPGESIEESGKSLAGRVFGVDRSSNRINPILFNSAASAITIDSSAFLPISLTLQLTDGAHHLS
jgi:hypothetical protein